MLNIFHFGHKNLRGAIFISFITLIFLCNLYVTKSHFRCYKIKFFPIQQDFLFM